MLLLYGSDPFDESRPYPFGGVPRGAALFDWLGFRYLRLRTVGEARPVTVGPTVDEAAPVEREAVAA